MAEMLINFDKPEDLISSVQGKQDSQYSAGNAADGAKADWQRKQRKVGKVKSNFSIHNMSQNRLETSEENGSNNALYPVGMSSEMPKTPDNDTKMQTKDSNRAMMRQVNGQDNFETVQAASKDNLHSSIKHQVFSHKETKDTGSKEKHRSPSNDDSLDKGRRGTINNDMSTLMEKKKKD